MAGLRVHRSAAARPCVIRRRKRIHQTSRRGIQPVCSPKQSLALYPCAGPSAAGAFTTDLQGFAAANATARPRSPRQSRPARRPAAKARSARWGEEHQVRAARLQVEREWPFDHLLLTGYRRSDPVRPPTGSQAAGQIEHLLLIRFRQQRQKQVEPPRAQRAPGHWCRSCRRRHRGRRHQSPAFSPHASTPGRWAGRSS